MDYYHIRVEMGEGIATQEVCHLQYYDLPTTIILLLEHWTLEHIVSRREVYIIEHQGFSKIGNGTSRCNQSPPHVHLNIYLFPSMAYQSIFFTNKPFKSDPVQFKTNGKEIEWKRSSIVSTFYWSWNLYLTLQETVWLVCHVSRKNTQHQSRCRPPSFRHLLSSLFCLALSGQKNLTI